MTAGRGPESVVQRDLRPDEDAVFGQWLDTGNRMTPDHACVRISWLIAERLEAVALGEGGLSGLYRDPADGRLWELSHPYAQLPGHGPPHLICLTNEEARARYGPGVVL